MKTSMLLLLLLATCTTFAQKLEKIWSSANELKTSESVLYNAEFNTIFTSCMGTENNDINDQDGFIAQLNLEGKITNLHWITGLNDPKGMAFFDGKLYVTDKTELVVIDVKKGKIEKKIPSDAVFLNDATVTSDGVVFASDMMGKSVYALINGKFGMWKHDERFSYLNGLWAENGKLYAGNNSLWEIDIETKEIKELLTDAGGIDGLETIGNGNFIFSNWGGKIYVSDNGKIIKLIDISEAKGHTADLDFIPATKMVLVPTFFENNVDAYKLVW